MTTAMNLVSVLAAAMECDETPALNVAIIGPSGNGFVAPVARVQLTHGSQGTTLTLIAESDVDIAKTYPIPTDEEAADESQSSDDWYEKEEADEEATE